MPLTRYEFKNAVSAFFEMSRDAAKRALPAHLEAMEVKHSLGVFAVTAFDFTGSEVGNYEELVLAVITPPVLGVGGEFPRSAFYPFVVGTSTEASREHAIERWHLPHYMADIRVEFEEKDGHMNVHAHEKGRPILDLKVSAHKWTRVNHLYQAFTVDSPRRFKADIHMEGGFTEHEEETGEIVIHPHPMCEAVLNADVASYPFRELWMRDGVQTFEELQTI
ncbi:MAG TPA: acetoacetate decarboxylase family protein [Candidatus Krumholzibacteria bacterium]|nr:acetoacetate decarboxylase family protein [Candidatus Krumholzibacteria bacterium]